MPTRNSSLLVSLLALVASVPAVTAAPHPEPSIDNVKVFIRDADYAYQPSHEMANVIKARDAALPLHKRAYAKVQACYTPQCTNCYTVFDNSLSSNSACIVAVSTACLIVSDLSSANIQFWNRSGCNGNRSEFKGCPKGTNVVGAPGTNSIGVHVGC